jgi:hypothetical protein
MKPVYIMISCFLVSCGIVKWEYPSKDVADELNNMEVLIRDCPEEMIINNFPMAGPKTTTENRYYIYKGVARQLTEFDTAWVRSHCSVKITRAD